MDSQQNEEHAAISEEEMRQAQVAADLADSNGTHACYVCCDDFIYTDILQLNCGKHWFCRECLPSVFEDAMNNESNFPPQCCPRVGEIRIEDFEHLLSISHRELIANYKSKVEEFKTHVSFRRYCGQAECKVFLPPSSYQDIENMTVADCPKCNRTTCIGCAKLTFKTSPHECVLETPKLNTNYGTEARFKSCPYCSTAVLLTDGCNHMTCICGGQWCFVCLQPYGNGDGHYQCAQYSDPEYDEEGFSQDGFHRDNGLDREGFNRQGYNIRGLDRDGNRISDFASLHINNRNSVAARPAGFLDVEDDDFEVAAILQLIAEQEAGVQHSNDDIDVLLEQRFGFRGARDEIWRNAPIGGAGWGEVNNNAPGWLDEEEFVVPERPLTPGIGDDLEDYMALPPLPGNIEEEEEEHGFNPEIGPEDLVDNDAMSLQALEAMVISGAALEVDAHVDDWGTWDNGDDLPLRPFDINIGVDNWEEEPENDEVSSDMGGNVGVEDEAESGATDVSEGIVEGGTEERAWDIVYIDLE